MEQYRLLNTDGRVTEFTGVRLAHESSKRPDSLRWTEISLYRTEGGNYIVHKVGRSVVFHEEGKPCSSGEEIPASALDADSKACPRCGVPGFKSAVNAGHPMGPPNWTRRTVRREQDRHTVHVSTAAEGAVESAYTQDDDGTTYLTRPARFALQEASKHDASISQAFNVQKVD